MDSLALQIFQAQTQLFFKQEIHMKINFYHHKEKADLYK